MALHIKTDGTHTEVKPLDGRYFSLDELQAFVGGWIEIVGLPDGRALVCNEEGKLKGLPYNSEATGLWQRFYGLTDVMVGDILIAEDNELER